MAGVSLQQVSKVFANGETAVRDLTLEIADGELLVVLGPSGSGKSTVLRLIAGLETPSAGRIVIGGRDVTAIPPQSRDLAMVFQNYALYPHKTVRENLAFGLRVRRAARIDERVRDAAALLGIDALLDRRPAELSGGQRQRVALGRAIVREPQAFLLDEPLSNLDPLLRVTTRAELALLHRRLGTTMVYVTHDQEEAMTLGTRVAVMRDGQVEQVAPPLDVFRQPANVFVAGFVGSPAMNLWAATASLAGDRLAIVSPSSSLVTGPAAPDWPAPRDVIAGVRPHDVELTGEEQADARGVVEVIEPLGATALVHVRVEGAPDLVRVIVPADRHRALGDRVGLRIRADRLLLFDAGTGRRLG